MATSIQKYVNFTHITKCIQVSFPWQIYQAIGVQPGEKGGVTLTTKKAGKDNKPASSLQTSNFGSSTSSRKTYRGIVNSTAKKGYRSDLRGPAVARASAIKKSQKPVKERPESKPRGKKAAKESS